MLNTLRRRVKRAGAPLAVHLPSATRRGPAAAILYYHALADEGRGSAVSVSAFRAHMEALAVSYRVMPLAGLVAEALGPGMDKDGKTKVAVTFDDGYASVVNFGLPILEEFGVPATIFVVTERMGGTPNWSERTPPGDRIITIGEAERWIAAGMSIESHTATHPNLRQQTGDRLDHELGSSRAFLQTQFGTGDGFSYPWGSHGPREQAAAKAAGYDYAVAIGWRRHHEPSDRFALARLPVTPSDRRRDVDLKVRGGYDWLELLSRVRSHR